MSEISRIFATSEFKSVPGCDNVALRPEGGGGKHRFFQFHM